ncbi:DNA sulfur modification protein DndB [Rheinheimera mesophila]|uniref:DNA sulfur modification protein DndB n=1 Tax=Rheinheimera mesophila TaxID=1547515 RepID=A0A3P3QLN6_9GAMM|nr:DNA sulfur modification protein DndB [Rheinheimera mesophila]KKL02486.1 DNA sulfur modification protein DndB [Rheinheimera mesophila]RRJ21329.1 DNA sulfur modification protein DndB [Rheinheimera mesophila]
MNHILSGNSFPAIKGAQAGHEYYIVMCPLKRLKKIFTVDETMLAVSDRAQRVLNHSRIPQITRYIHNNRFDYTFSSLTACIEGHTSFQPIAEEGHGSKIGTLLVDEDAEFYLTDGQHRSAAIQQALEEDPSLGDETISVVFFVNKNLKERQKIFRDLNLYPVPTSKSIAVLYGSTPEENLTNKVVNDGDFFNGVVEFSDSRLSKRSSKFFMHSSLHAACMELCRDITEDNWEKQAQKAIDYWDTLATNLPLWQQAKAHQIKPADRGNYVLFSAVLLKSFAQLGKELLSEHKNWKTLLKQLQKLNWDRTNKIWADRCFSKGRMDHSSHSVTLTLNILKKHMSLNLTAEQQKVEDKFLGSAK